MFQFEAERHGLKLLRTLNIFLLTPHDSISQLNSTSLITNNELKHRLQSLFTSSARPAASIPGSESALRAPKASPNAAADLRTISQPAAPHTTTPRAALHRPIPHIRGAQAIPQLHTIALGLIPAAIAAQPPRGSRAGAHGRATQRRAPPPPLRHRRNLRRVRRRRAAGSGVRGAGGVHAGRHGRRGGDRRAAGGDGERVVVRGGRRRPGARLRGMGARLVRAPVGRGRAAAAAAGGRRAHLAAAPYGSLFCAGGAEHGCCAWDYGGDGAGAVPEGFV